MGIIYDSDGIPDWQNVRLTEDEIGSFEIGYEITQAGKVDAGEVE